MVLNPEESHFNITQHSHCHFKLTLIRFVTILKQRPQTALQRSATSYYNSIFLYRDSSAEQLMAG